MVNAVLLSPGRRLAGSLALVLTLNLAVSSGGAAQSDSSVPERSVPLPVFVPSDVGAPATRIIGGVRGIGRSAVPVVLASERTGLTGDPQPVLFVYVERSSAAALEVTITDDRTAASAPLLEADLGPVPAPGIYEIDLRTQGVRLEAERIYRWQVAALVDPDNRAQNPGSSGTITWVEPDRQLRTALEGAPMAAQVDALARAGFWYDALALVSRQIAAADQSAPWREFRATLLDQVGLHEAAGFDRASEHTR